jgi:hypothetical protein
MPLRFMRWQVIGLLINLKDREMNNYDTFYTIEYRGHYIHCKYNRDTKKEEFTLHGFHSIKLKSLLSAKQRITKIIGHNKG